MIYHICVKHVSHYTTEEVKSQQSDETERVIYLLQTKSNFGLYLKTTIIMVQPRLGGFKPTVMSWSDQTVVLIACYIATVTMGRQN